MKVYCFVRFLVLISLISLVGCMTPFQSVKYPEPTTGYQPQKKFNVSYERMWDVAEQVLENNNINVTKSDKQKKKIVTDYKAGDVKLKGLGMLGIIQYRYKYQIGFDSSTKLNTILNISCIVESSMAGMNSWSDVTNENLEIASQLQNWLYEQIQKSI